MHLGRLRGKQRKMGYPTPGRMQERNNIERTIKPKITAPSFRFGKNYTDRNVKVTSFIGVNRSSAIRRLLSEEQSFELDVREVTSGTKIRNLSD
jgi:hypothetical protein